MCQIDVRHGHFCQKPLLPAGISVMGVLGILRVGCKTELYTYPNGVSTYSRSNTPPMTLPTTS